MGHARELTEQRERWCSTLAGAPEGDGVADRPDARDFDGRPSTGAVSVSRVRRLYKQHGVDQVRFDAADGRIRLRGKQTAPTQSGIPTLVTAGAVGSTPRTFFWRSERKL